MSLFIEVNSIDKGCPVIINLDTVVEIAPLAAGGCALFFPDSAAVGGKTAMKVTDTYEQFKQFAIQPVSAADIAARFPKVERTFVKREEETPETPEKQVKSKKASMPEYDIPKL
jgi:hypothetical protein